MPQTIHVTLDDDEELVELVDDPLFEDPPSVIKTVSKGEQWTFIAALLFLVYIAR